MEDVKWMMDNGAASAEISVICGSKTLKFLNSLNGGKSLLVFWSAVSCAFRLGSVLLYVLLRQ